MTESDDLQQMSCRNVAVRSDLQPFRLSGRWMACGSSRTMTAPRVGRFDHLTVFLAMSYGLFETVKHTTEECNHDS